MRKATVEVTFIPKEYVKGKFRPYTPIKVVRTMETSTGNHLNLSLNMKSQSRIIAWERILEVGARIQVDVKKHFNTKREYIDFEGEFKLIDRKINVKILDPEDRKKNNRNAAQLALAL